MPVASANCTVASRASMACCAAGGSALSQAVADCSGSVLWSQAEPVVSPPVNASIRDVVRGVYAP